VVTEDTRDDGDDRLSEGLRVERADGTVTVTLDRPHRKNAVTEQGWAHLLEALRGVRPGQDRVLVLTGAGEDFCAGADLAATPGQATHPLHGMRAIGDTCLALHRLPVPTVARVDGVAVGAGMNLALACDLVVASDRARFSQIFVKRGLSLDFGGSWVLPRLIGLHRAKELALLGTIIDGRRADELGLVHRLVAPEQLDETVAALVAELRAAPPVALLQTRMLLNNAFDVTLAQALDDEARSQSVNLVMHDAQEAFEAFLAKRPPVFEGR
jgi:enoyl-CoA hydratase/carnithine racemase